MKNLTPFFMSCFLVFGAAACQDAAKTSVDAPGTTTEAAKTPNAETVKSSQEDAQSQTRRDQLNSDIRSREQRNNVTGGDDKRAVGDLKSQVRSKLEANIPRGQLAVEAEENGTVTVSGTVLNDKELAKIEPLAKQIKGVKNVVVKATVAPPKN